VTFSAVFYPEVSFLEPGSAQQCIQVYQLVAWPDYTIRDEVQKFVGKIKDYVSVLRYTVNRMFYFRNRKGISTVLG